MNLQVQRALEANLVALKTLTQPLVEFGVVGLPEFVTDMDPPKVYIAVTKAQPRFLATRRDLIHAPTLFVLIRRTRVEHHAITRLEWADEFKRNSVISHTRHIPKEHATFFT